MSRSAKFSWKRQGVKTQIASKTRRAQFKLDQQIAKDSNYYCPEDVGSLQKSVLPSAQSGAGLLVWDEKYAQAQYYRLPGKSLDKNPNARMRWFEHAKAAFTAKWIRLAQNGFTR